MTLSASLGVQTPFDPSHGLVTSYVFSSKALAAIRLSLALYTATTLLVILIWDGVKLHTAQSFFSYFTELSYIGICAYLWASGIQTLHHALRGHKGFPLQRWHSSLQALHLVLLTTVTTFPILVTIVFWAVLADSDTFSDSFQSWSNISIHALNTVIVIFEVFFTNIGPFPWTHLPITIVLLACYLGVAYITHATQGFYTYSFLNPQKEGAALVGWIVGIAVAEVIIFVIVRYLIAVRKHYNVRRAWLAGTVDARTSYSSEGTDEWQTVERPSV